MSTHLNEFKTLLSQLQAQEVEFQVFVKAMFLLVTLPNSWDTFRTSINNSAPKNGLKCADVDSSLLMEKLNCKNVDDPGSLSTAFIVASNGTYEQDWIVDFGASFHVTPHTEWFSSYEESCTRRTTLGSYYCFLFSPFNGGGLSSPSLVELFGYGAHYSELVLLYTCVSVNGDSCMRPTPSNATAAPCAEAALRQLGLSSFFTYQYTSKSRQPLLEHNADPQRALMLALAPEMCYITLLSMPAARPELMH
ncbi:hypothetical protein L7F22_017315 [Adiantum nelumboides]|nr:hypothetical protein [Adiantum nelumboides]